MNLETYGCPRAVVLPRSSGPALLSIGLLLAGCASTSTTSDVRRVRDLTNTDTLARVADTDVDPAADEEARRLLSEPLDADSAVRVSLLNNRHLRAVLREMGIARGRLVQAGLLPNPRVEAELLPERNTRLELRVEYEITAAVLAPLRARALEPGLEAARLRAAAAVLSLGYEVRVAFFALQAAERRLNVAVQTLDALAAGRDAARALLEAGNVPELDAASQVAAYERARIVVAQQELAVATEREHLQRLLGVHGEEARWQIVGELEPVPRSLPPLDRLENRALRASLKLQEAKHHLEGLARRAGVARTSGWLPDIVADVHTLRGNPEGEPGEADDWLIGGGLNVSIPIFDRNQGIVAALTAELDASLERYYGLAIDLRSAAREARNRLRSAHARALHYQEVILPAQQTVTRQSLLQYNAMQIDVFQLLQARRDELSAELAYVETLREYWTSAVELEALLAGAPPVGPSAARPPAQLGGAESMEIGWPTMGGGH